MYLPRDVIGGALLVAVGAAFFIGASRFRIDSLMNMGPGYFPRAVAVLLIGIGLAVVIVGIRNAERSALPEWRPALAVLAAIGAFALTVRSVGLVPAMTLGAVIASFGDSTARLWPSVLLGAGIGAWLVFRVGLGLQLPGLIIPIRGW